MTIREFQSKLGAAHTTNRLFSALRRLRTVDNLQVLEGDVVASSNWIVWGDLTESGCAAQGS
jgi:hypothetical protein